MSELITPSEYKILSNGCWQWQLSLTTDGYGQKMFRHPRRQIRAHRLYYATRYGEIPPGLFIDHLCRNRACVNPEHLEAVTNKENILRGVGATASNARKTHCKRGHEFTAENTIVQKLGRACRTCVRANRLRRETI